MKAQNVKLALLWLLVLLPLTWGVVETGKRALQLF